MDKHLDGDILSDYAEGLLDGPARATADAHLQGCADCRRELVALSAYFTGMAGLEPAKAPADFLIKVRARLPQEPAWRRALAAALRPLRVVPVQLALATLLGVTAVTVYLQQGGPDAGLRSEIPAARPASPAAVQAPVPAEAAAPEPAAESSRETHTQSTAEPAKKKAEQPATEGYLADEKRGTLAKSKSARRARSDQEEGDDRAVGSLGGKGSASASGSAVAKPGSMASGSGAEFRGPAPAAAPIVNSAPPAPKPMAKTLADAPADKESKAKPAEPAPAAPAATAPSASRPSAASRQELDALSSEPARAVSREAEAADDNSSYQEAAPARAPVAGLSSKDARPRTAAKEPMAAKAEAAPKAYGADKANTAGPAAYTLRLKPAADTAALFRGLRAMGVKVEADRSDPAVFILQAPAGMETEIVPYLTRYGSAQVNGIGSRIRLRLVVP